MERQRSAKEQRARNIFAVCYGLLAKYENGIADEDWHDIYSYHEGKLDGNDPMAVEMFTVCVSELHRQYSAEKSPQQDGG